MRERHPELFWSQSHGHIGHLGDLPSRGLETGVVPLVLLQIGDATGVMAVGDAKPVEQRRELFSISGSFLEIPWKLLDLS